MLTWVQSITLKLIFWQQNCIQVAIIFILFISEDSGEIYRLKKIVNFNKNLFFLIALEILHKSLR